MRATYLRSRETWRRRGERSTRGVCPPLDAFRVSIRTFAKQSDPRTTDSLRGEQSVPGKPLSPVPGALAGQAYCSEDKYPSGDGRAGFPSGFAAGIDSIHVGGGESIKHVPRAACAARPGSRAAGHLQTEGDVGWAR